MLVICIPSLLTVEGDFPNMQQDTATAYHRTRIEFR